MAIETTKPAEANTSTDAVKTECLIVGAGPAGLMAAACLVKLGIDFIIIDQRLPGESYGQADGIQPRTIEMWDSLGLGEELRRRGFHLYKMAQYVPDSEMGGIKLAAQHPNITAATARYPYETIIPIEVMEEMLARPLLETGRRVVQPALPLALEVLEEDAAEYPVKTHIAHLDADYMNAKAISLNDRARVATSGEGVTRVQVVEAKYLIACDGSRSWVRNHLGIKMSGDIRGTSYGVFDFTPVTDFPTPRAKSLISAPLGAFFGWIPRPGDTARIYMDMKTVEGADAIATMSGDRLRDALTKSVSEEFKPYNLKIDKVTWASIFSVVQRTANFFTHKDRIFLAGDSCHMHSPMAGQGANASMTDSYNLAWKLAHVLRGLASPVLLQTYEAERRTYAIKLIEFDKEIHKLFRPDDFSPAEYAELLDQQNMFSTGIGVRYDSALSLPGCLRLPGSLVVGARVPPAALVRYCDWRPFDILDVLQYNMAWKLLVFPGDIVGSPEARAAFVAFCEGMDKWITSGQVEAFAFPSIAKDAILPQNGIPRCVSLNAFYVDSTSDGALCSKYGIEGPTAALVRVDGHVAILVPADIGEVGRISAFLEGL